MVTFKDESRNAHLLCIEDSLIDAEGLSNLDSRNVHGKGCNRSEAYIAAKASAIVLRLPTVNVNRAVLNDGVGRVTVFKTRDEHERLKRGTGLTFSHSRAIELVSAASADHSPDIARLRFDCHDCPLRLNHSISVGVVLRQVSKQSLLRHALHIQINRRVDLQAFLINRVGSVPVYQKLRDVLDKIHCVLMLFRDVRRRKDNFGVLSGLRLVEADVAVMNHLVKDSVTAFNRGVNVVERRVVVWTLRNARQHCAFP